MVISGHAKMPERTGKMKDVNKFDAIFFGVNQKLADVMDPMTRMGMECAYEAIADAGKNPRLMKGTNCAVFAANGFSETEKTIWEGTGGDVRFAGPQKMTSRHNLLSKFESVKIFTNCNQ